MSQITDENEPKKTYIWLDCDPGTDDAMAIILALCNPSLHVLGISVAAGNNYIDKVLKNALDVLNIAGFVQVTNGTYKKEVPSLEDIQSVGGLFCPVLRGAEKPLLRNVFINPKFHGETLANINFDPLPANTWNYALAIAARSKHFTTAMYEMFKALQKPVTIVTCGPLTNIALLLTNYPDVKNYIGKIVSMGGAMGMGNVTPCCEFNFRTDPEAAHIVFEAGVPCYLVPLEVTHTVLVTPEILAQVEAMNTPFSRIVHKLLSFFKDMYKKKYNADSPPLHDPTAVAFAIDPTLFEYKLMRVDMELASPHSYGQTICDIHNTSESKEERKNVHVCLKIHKERFWKLMLDALHVANNRSPLNKKP